MTLEQEPTRKDFKEVAQFEGRLELRGIPSLRWEEVMQLRSFGGEVMLEMVNRTEEADGFIVNTFYELEAPPIDAIRQNWE